MALLVYLHTMAQSAMELLALIGPPAVIFGAGTFIVIGAIVRSGGERYQHKEYEPHQAGHNGNGHGPKSEVGQAPHKAPPAPVRRKN
ncbi:MAG TPA: hypothetical protein VKI99_18045 [Candidatus Dormibacteraeota bacterium]|nr:hypothetical protein [Candidatus Dormibacteraeota bacterium]